MGTILNTDFNTERDNSAADEADQTRALTAQETEWKQRINERLLTVLDLSLIDSVDSDNANKEIREIAERLLTEESAPLSRKQRRLIVERIVNEVMGLGPLEPLLADPTISVGSSVNSVIRGSCSRRSGTMCLVLRFIRVNPENES